MKKKILIAACLTAMSTGFTQGGFVGLNVGYGLGMPKEIIGQRVEWGSTSFTRSNIYGSMGNGLNFGLLPGYMFTENIGFDLGINYFSGAEQIQYEEIDQPFDYERLTTKRASQLRIMPNVIVESSGNTLSLYAKAGLVLPLAQKIVITDREDDNGDILEETMLVKSKLSLGTSGTVGVNFNLTSQLSLFGELQGMLLKTKRSTMSTQTLTYNGQDIKDLQDKSYLEQEYVEELSSNDNTNPDVPEKRLVEQTNFGTVIFNFGLKFNF